MVGNISVIEGIDEIQNNERDYVDFRSDPKFLAAVTKEFENRESFNEIHGRISEGMKIAGRAILFRGHGARGVQRVHGHGDGAPGHHHGVLPATSGYKIDVYPGTHLVHKSFAEARADKHMVNSNQKEELRLKRGDLLLFHSSMAHAGASLNRKNMKVKMDFLEDVSVDWFPPDKRAQKITDMALHFDIEDATLGKTFASESETGRLAQLRIHEKWNESSAKSVEKAKDELKQC